jgi:polar amino acid transport system substrate-binding protein
MSAIAGKLGLTVTYTQQNFDTLNASVAAGTKMDLAVSSITINPERKQQVDFCDPYFDSNQACVALATSTATQATDFDGMTVGAQSGTTGSAWVTENLKNANLKNYNATSELLAALRAGDIQAAFFDEPVAAAQVASTYSDCKIVQSIATGEQYGFAVSKDNPGLESAVDNALQELIQDGTYDQIFSKYFNFAPTIG